MLLIKKVIKWIGYLLLIPISYFLISLLLSYITVNKKPLTLKDNQTIYLNTNGVHSDIIIPSESINDLLKSKLSLKKTDAFCAFGWGEENFYLKTPNWKDLTFSNAFKALFLKNNTLINTKRYQKKIEKWTLVNLTKEELKKVNDYIFDSFKLDSNNDLIIVPSSMYSKQNVFYKANGHYSSIKTCNSWVNSCFKESGLKACLWTPFDFGILQKYK